MANRIHESSSGPSQREGEGGSRAEVTLVPADLRNLTKLARIPNDTIVTFDPGKVTTMSAFGFQFFCCEFRSRGKIPGTDDPLPPIRLFTREEFAKLMILEGRKDPHLIDAVWSEPTGVIYAQLPGEQPGSHPPTFSIRAEAVKRLLGNIYHEAAHAAGGNEFDAYRKEMEIQERLGFEPDYKSPLEIMRHIAASYDTVEIGASEKSFYQQASMEEVAAYSEDVERDQELGGGLGRKACEEIEEFCERFEERYGEE